MLKAFNVKKEDRTKCKNYRGIRLTKSAYKIYASLLNNRLRPIRRYNIQGTVIEEQSGFRRGRSCIDNVFTLQQIIEKYQKCNDEIHLASLDYEKDVEWELIMGYHGKKGHPKTYKNM